MANEPQYHQFQRSTLVRTADPDGDLPGPQRPRTVDMLKCHAGDQVRMVRLIPEENCHESVD
ncbi:hypothetical protein LNQ03_08275 [Klebsiella pneumoniae subsp. pneumoniae]|nr:hypothetical protein [Klebsiella pneumoniae subsp. pneumoniae]